MSRGCRVASARPIQTGARVIPTNTSLTGSGTILTMFICASCPGPKRAVTTIVGAINHCPLDSSMPSNEPISGDPPVCAVFVYGTLQQGECRVRYWPHPPRQVEDATIRGRLYNLGPFPALTEGDDAVAGELWTLAPEHLERTLEVLDEVEATAGPGELYQRRLVTCRTASGREAIAHVYFYARPEELQGYPTIAPSDDGRCHWKHVSDRPRQEIE